jgi:hypothetical protein
MENEENQSLNQKKIALAQSEHAPIIIELMKDCMGQVPDLIADTEWETIVRAIRLDIHGKILTNMVNHLEGIRQGKLHTAEVKEPGK